MRESFVADLATAGLSPAMVDGLIAPGTPSWPRRWRAPGALIRPMMTDIIEWACRQGFFEDLAAEN